MFLLTDFLGHIFAILKRFVTAFLFPHTSASLFRSCFALPERHLGAVLLLLLHPPHPLDLFAFSLRQLLAGVWQIGPNLVIVILQNEISFSNGNLQLMC